MKTIKCEKLVVSFICPNDNSMKTVEVKNNEICIEEEGFYDDVYVSEASVEIMCTGCNKLHDVRLNFNMA